MQVRRMRRVAVAIVIALLATACGSAAEVGEIESEAGDASAAATDAAAGDAGAGPVRIGALTALTGPFAQFGVSVANGMQLAADDINASGGADGRQIELVERDTQGDPGEATTAIRGMIANDGVVAVGGVISSDVGLATARIAESQQVPLLLAKAGAAPILTADSRYTFRTCLPAAPMTMGPVADYLEQQGLNRAGAIIADYAYGRSIEAAFDTTLGDAGIETRVAVAPVPETDFTSYLRDLRAFEPDVIVATGHPPGSSTITSQAAQLDIDAPVIGPWASLSTVVDAVGEAAYDRFVDFSCADYSDPEYQELAARYHEQFGVFMEADAVAGYAIVTMVAESVAAVGDDPVDVAAHLHDSTFNPPGYAWDVSWTPWGELAGAQPVVSILRKQQPPDGVNPGAEWYPEVLLVAEPLEPYEPE